nr:cytosolic enolase 3 [Tanacetum cinerariifolium]
MHGDVMLVKMAVLLLTSPGIFKEGLDLVKEPIDKTCYSDKIKIATDVAAIDFCI